MERCGQEEADGFKKRTYLSGSGSHAAESASAGLSGGCELIRKRLNVRHMHQECVKYVNAQSQAKTLEIIFDMLNPEEQDLVRRGKNAHAHHPAPKNQGLENYSAATGFESLIGYLYLTGQDDRLGEIFRVCFSDEKKS